MSKQPTVDAPGADTRIDIGQREVLERLARLEAPRVPTFYECGIIDAGIGYYQLARLPNDQQILLFALNLEDLQLREYPVYGKLFAHPGTFYGVNAYEEATSNDEIFRDLINHQTGFRRLMREEYTLTRTSSYASTGNTYYQSRAVSYSVKNKTDAGHSVMFPTSTVAIEASIDPLHRNKYAPVNCEVDAHRLYAQWRVSRISLDTGPINHQESVFHILNHFTDHLNKLVEGRDVINDEYIKLSIWSRTTIHAKMFFIRFAHRITHAFDKTISEVRERNPTAVVELVQRGLALFKVSTIRELGVEFFSALWEAFNLPPLEDTEQRTPELLKPYIIPHRTRSQLNPYLYRLDSTAIETMVPLNMEQAGVVPQDARILSGNPFNVSKEHAPDIGALRAPLGTILHVYANTTLMMQANGVWMALHHDSGCTYAGYNQHMDTRSKPTPPPILQSWLGNGQVICYTREGHGHKVTKMDWKDAAHHLQEIIDHGDDHHLIETHEPTTDHGPHVLPMRNVVGMTYLDFTSALEQHNEKIDVANVTATTDPSVKLQSSLTKKRGRLRHKRRGSAYAMAP